MEAILWFLIYLQVKVHKHAAAAKHTYQSASKEKGTAVAMSAGTGDSMVWVKWERNNSKRHDGTTSGVHKDSLLHSGAPRQVGDVVDVFWGRGKGRVWHGILPLHHRRLGRRQPATNANGTHSLPPK